MNEEYYDITPVCLQFTSDFDNPWIHPNIKELYTPDPNMAPFEHDTDVWRIYYKNSRNETLYVYFKSQRMDEISEKFDMGLPKQDFWKPPYIDAKLAVSYLKLVLLEDIWMPGGEQFCFTEFGQKVSNFFSYDPEITLFTPDCGMVPHTDKNGTEWIFES